MKFEQKGIHFTLSGEGIGQLGFIRVPEGGTCRRHMFNNIRVPIDLRERDDYLLSSIEDDLNEIFGALLIKEMHECGVLAVKSIEWDRIFFIGPEFHPKKFTAVFYVRFDSVDNDDKKETDSHRQWI